MLSCYTSRLSGISKTHMWTGESERIKSVFCERHYRDKSVKKKTQYYKDNDEASRGKEEQRRKKSSWKSNIKKQALPSKKNKNKNRQENIMRPDVVY